MTITSISASKLGTIVEIAGAAAFLVGRGAEHSSLRDRVADHWRRRCLLCRKEVARRNRAVICSTSIRMSRHRSHNSAKYSCAKFGIAGAYYAISSSA